MGDGHTLTPFATICSLIYYSLRLPQIPVKLIGIDCVIPFNTYRFNSKITIATIHSQNEE